MPTTRSKRIQRQWNKAFGAELSEESLVERKSAPEPWESFAGAVPNFLSSVEDMYNQLEDRANMAQRSLELSSEELTVANARLFSLNKTFDAILNSLGQGFALFNRDGLGQQIYSKACESLLEANPQDMKLADVLKVPAGKRAALEEWYEFLCQELIDFDDGAALGPRQFSHSAGRSVQLEYKPVRDSDGKIEFVLIIATDRTKEVEALKEAEKAQSFATFISSILKNKTRFGAFVKDFRERIVHCERMVGASSNPKDFVDLKNHLHSIKGATGLFGLSAVKNKVHESESLVVDIQSRGDSLEVMLPELRAINELFEETIRQNEMFLGDMLRPVSTTLQVEMTKLLSFEEELSKLGPAGEKLRARFQDEFFCTPLFTMLSDFNEELQTTAQKLGKQINRIDFSGDNIPLRREAFEPLLMDLGHLFRNIADHGIENPSARQAAGKPAAGSVRIQGKRLGAQFELSISDDGGGINEEALRKKLSERKITVGNREELLDSIFRSDVSTAREITDLSGRGVGLTALRSSVEHLGGSIHVQSSELGKGISFRLVLPVNPS